MRDPKRIDEITNLLNKVWHKNPDLRFWQLLAIIPMYKVWKGSDLFYVEDEKTKKALEVMLKEEI